MPLTGKQRHHLRALAHHLSPLVQFGHEGLTEAVVAQVDAALSAHELIKVRVGAECPVDRSAAAEAVSAATRADVAQVIGRVIVLYRRRPQKPKVELPTRGGEERKAKPKGSKGHRPRARKKKERRVKHGTRKARGPARRRTPGGPPKRRAAGSGPATPPDRDDE